MSNGAAQTFVCSPQWRSNSLFTLDHDIKKTSEVGMRNRRPSLALSALLVMGVIALWFFPIGDNNLPSPTGAPIANVTVPELDSAALTGETKFNERCAACHGANAAGQDGIAPPLVHKIYEPSHHGDQSFYLAAMRGVRSHHWPFGDMPPVEGRTDEDIRYVIAYVRSLQRANGIE